MTEYDTMCCKDIMEYQIQKIKDEYDAKFKENSFINSCIYRIEVGKDFYIGSTKDFYHRTNSHNQYVINGVPLIEANFDSDYWIVMDTIQFQTPMYRYLGWFNDQSMNTPIAVGSHTYTMNSLIDLHPPTNIAGYQIPKHFCTECPYAPTLVGTYSKYNYNPTQNLFLDDEMVGDTINIFIETVFNTEGGIWYHGHSSPVPKETITNQIKIIII